MSDQTASGEVSLGGRGSFYSFFRGLDGELIELLEAKSGYTEVAKILAGCPEFFMDGNSKDFASGRRNLCSLRYLLSNSS